MYLLAADCGGTLVKGALIRDGEILVCGMLPTSKTRGQLLSALSWLETCFSACCANQRIAFTDCNAVGFALACLVDPIERRVLSAVKGKYEDAPAVDLMSWARDRFGLPLILETDSRAALVGEWRYGAGRGRNNIVMMTLGTAIGVAVLIQGKLLRGVHFQAGIGGHLIVNPGGRLCNCGGRGCVTAEASTWALPPIVQSHPGYSESALAREVCLDYGAIFRLAAAGDELAREIRDRSLGLWSAAVVSLIHAFDPEIVILGGGVLRSAEVILPYVQAYVDRHAWTPWGRVEVCCARHLTDAALLGVASLAVEGVEAL